MFPETLFVTTDMALAGHDHAQLPQQTTRLPTLRNDPGANEAVASWEWKEGRRELGSTGWEKRGA